MMAARAISKKSMMMAMSLLSSSRDRSRERGDGLR